MKSHTGSRGALVDRIRQIQTQAELAKHLGIARETVSRAFGDSALVAPALKKRIMSVATEVGYFPNAAARAVRGQKTKTVGVLLRNKKEDPFHNSTAFELTMAINLTLEDQEYLMMLIRLSDVSEGSVKSRIFQERVVDAFICIDNLPEAAIVRVQQLQAPVVFLESNHFEERGSIRRDEIHAGREAARYLAACGREHIVWFGPLPELASHFSVGERFSGVRDFCAESSIHLTEISPPKMRPTPHHLALLAASIRQGAGVVAYDMLHAHLLAAIGATDIDLIPLKDFSLVCCDDTADSRVAWPNLPRISNDRERMGRSAATMVLQMLTNPNAKCPSVKIRGKLAGSVMPAER